jgi:hypothetical protein
MIELLAKVRNNRGVHGVPAFNPPDERDWDRWISELKAMHIAWYKLLDDGYGSSLAFARELLENDIIPIVRIYRDDPYPGRLPKEHLNTVKQYVSAGITLFEIGHQPNLPREWKADWRDGLAFDSADHVNRVVDDWIEDAQKVLDAGGFPAFPALAPTDRNGTHPEFSSVRWFGRMVDRLRDEHFGRAQELFGRGAWLAVHVSPRDRPFDFAPDRGRFRDDCCLRGYEVYLDLLEETLGVRGVPIISTGGGVFTPKRMEKDGWDRPYGEQEMARKTVETYRWLAENEWQVVAMCPWVLANAEMGHHDPRWEGDEWYQRDRVLPVVDALKGEPPAERVPWRMLSDQPAKLTFHNNTGLDVTLHWVDFEDREVLRSTLQPGKSTTLDTYVTHTWIVREAGTQRWLATKRVRKLADGTVSDVFVEDSFEGHPATRIEFYNRTLLTLDVYWRSGGLETHTKTLLPQERHAQSTFESHRWVVREAHSGRHLASVVAGKTPRTVCVESSSLRSTRGGPPISNLTFRNAAPFPVTVHRINSADKRETVVVGLSPGHSFASDSRYAHDLFVACEQATGREVFACIAAKEDGQAFDIRPRTYTYPAGEIGWTGFANQTSLTLALSFLDQDGKKRPLRDLVPGAAVNLPAPVTQPWIVRDKTSGRVADFILTAREKQDLVINGEFLRALDKEVPVTVRVHNTTPIPVCVYTVDTKGQERELGRIAAVEDLEAPSDGEHPTLPDGSRSLQPGETSCYQTYATHPIRIREKSSQAEVAMFIPQARTPGAELTYDVKLRSHPGASATSLEFVNQTPLALNLNSFDQNGDETTCQSLGPKESLAMSDARARQPWVARDQHSGRVIAFALASSQAQSVPIGGGEIRSHRSETPVKVTFHNPTFYTVDLCRIPEQGDDECKATLAPGKSQEVQTFAGHVFRVREQASGEELYLFIATSDAEQTCKIQDTLIRRKERADGQLLEGEVALYKDEEFRGKVWILRNGFADFGQIAGLDESISSLKVGPNTGVTLFTEPDYEGTNDVFYLDSPSLVGSDVGEDRISSIKVWRIVSQEKAGVTIHTSLSESYRLKEGQENSAPLEKYPSYRSILSFPQGVQEVEIWSTEATKIEVQDRCLCIDSVKSALLKPNALSTLVIDIEAKKLATPALKLRTNLMDYGEHVLIFPDRYIHQRMIGLEENEIWENRAALGISPEIDQDTCNGIQSTIQNLARTVRYASEPPAQVTEGQQVSGEGMEYTRWMLDRRSPDGGAAYRPLSREEARLLTQNAERVDEQLAQGIFDWVEDIGAFIVEDVGGSIVEGLEDLGEGALEVVDAIGDAGREALEAIGDAGLKVIGELGERGMSALVELGEEGAKALAALGREGFEAVADLGEEGLATLEKIGAEGLQALERLGQEGLEAVLKLSDSVQSTLVKLGEDIYKGVKKALVVTIQFGERVLQFVLDTAKKVGDFMEKVWEQIGVVWEKLMEWLDAFFNWGDILDTHDALVQVVNDSLDHLPPMFAKMKTAASGLFRKLEKEVERGISNYQRQLGVADVAQSGSQSSDLVSEGLQEVTWLLSKLFDYMPSFSPPQLLPELLPGMPGGGGGDRYRELTTKLASNAFAEQADAMIETLESSFAYLQAAVKDPGKTGKLLVGALLEIAKQIALAGLSLVDDLTGLLFDVLAQAVKSFKSFMNGKWDIPFISQLYSLITKGRPLTLLSLVSLVIAAPVTVIGKLSLDRKPRLAQGVVNDFEQWYSQGWGLVYASSHFVLGVTSPLGLLPQVGPWVGTLNLVVGFVAMLAAHPRGYPMPLVDAVDKGETIIPTKAIGDCDWREKPGEMYKIIWLFAWAQWGFDLLSAQLGAKHQKVTAPFQTLFGLAELGLFSALAVYDRKKIDGDEASKKWDGGPYNRKTFGNIMNTVTPICSAIGLTKNPWALGLGGMLIVFGQFGEGGAYLHRSLAAEFF